MKVTLKDLDSRKALVTIRRGGTYSIQYRSVLNALYFPNVKYVDYIHFNFPPLKRIDFDLLFRSNPRPDSPVLGICIYTELSTSKNSFFKVLNDTL
jgi:hypothetical protein